MNDLSGRTFARLLVLGRVRNGSKWLWLCRCECGNETHASAYQLRDGRSKSCGCLKRDRLTKHGHARDGATTRVYRTWQGMLARCSNPNEVKWERYGGRGIVVCARWREFANFLADMGERPPDTTLDRINNDRHYSCGHCDECKANAWAANCRWATRHEQNRNKSVNHWVSVNGEPLVLRDAVIKTGVDDKTLVRSLRNGTALAKYGVTEIALCGRRILEGC